MFALKNLLVTAGIALTAISTQVHAQQVPLGGLNAKFESYYAGLFTPLEDLSVLAVNRLVLGVPELVRWLFLVELFIRQGDREHCTR